MKLIHALSVALRPDFRSNLFAHCCQHIVTSVLLLVSSSIYADAVDFERQSIRIAMLQEPPTMNSMMATDLISSFVLGHTMEGLLRYDRRGQLTVGVAETWSVEPEKIVFKLRDNARWSDGQPVTAHDFVFAWRLINDPANASPNASVMRPIKNATAIQRGEMSPEMLGVSAPHDRTLVVSLERACGYCLELTTLWTYLPVRSDFYERQGSRYGAETDTLLFNGPFLISEWTHESRLLLTKNPDYWNADAIVLNEIDVAYITSDNRTRLNLFRDNQIALARLGAETAKDAARSGHRLRTFSSGGLAFVWFNMRDGRETADVNLRRAIRSAVDQQAYVNQVIAIPGYRPATSLFPSWLRGQSRPFVEEYPPPRIDINPQEARKNLEALRAQGALAESLVILTVTSPTGLRAAEYFQGVLKQRLGLDTKVDHQSFKQYLHKARTGQFDLALASWYPDFNDLVTFADLLDSTNPNNRGRYVSEKYDRHLATVVAEVDPVRRFAAAAELQRLVISDVPLLPMAETASAYLVHPRLKGVVRRVIGQDPDYTFARVIK